MSSSTGAQNEARPDDRIVTSPRSQEGVAPPGPVNSFFYTLVRLSGLALLRTIFRVRIVNRPKLEEGKPWLIAANHISYMDPIALQGVLHRRVFFMMTDRIYRQAAVHWFFKFVRVIPVRESAINRQSLIGARTILDRGQVVGIFPEGGLSRDGVSRRARPGIGALALDTRVPIIPVAIQGTDRAFPPGAWFPRPRRIRIVFGEPITFDEVPVDSHGRDRRHQLQQVTDRIMSEIELLKAQHA